MLTIHEERGEIIERLSPCVDKPDKTAKTTPSVT